MEHAARIGIIGAGWIGSFHAQTVGANRNAELVAICADDEDQAGSAAAASGAEASIYTDFRRLLEHDLDGVIIATPNALHAEMSIAAAQAGKHVFCEKPMAITLEQCEAVQQAVTAAGVRYLIGYHRRLNPLYAYVKRMLDAGTLGRPFLAESEYNHHVPGDLPLWEWLGKADVAGSIFHAGGGHCVDLLRYFLGEIVEVTAFTDVFLPRAAKIETEDTAVALYRFENGAIGKVQACVGPVLPFDFGFRLFATDGSVVNNNIWTRDMPGFDDARSTPITLPAGWIPDNVQGGVAETWPQIIDHFVDVVRGDAASINDVESAMATARAVFATLEAAETATVVRL